MMKLLSLITFFVLSAALLHAKEEQKQFTIVKEVKHSPVISQGSTGTCWSFATTSFLESEVMRKGLPETDLSEMYFVYFTYLNKANQYLLYHGNNNFSQGGQAHDVLNVLREQGVSTFGAFPGKKVEDKYKHRELVAQLEQEIRNLNKEKDDFNANELSSLKPILKEHLGKLPKKIKANEENLSPLEFKNKLELNPDDYIELTSYTHHPFYKAFVLEVPDNWAHNLYYNLPIDELMEVMYFALNNGYSVCWDGDTSEETFRHKKGVADLPEKQLGKVSQELRQTTFYDRTTTDDHLMHIVGLSENPEGRDCFFTKNSWGDDSNNYGGYLHMTDDYVRLKTIAILVHKDAIPAAIKTKLGM